MTKIKLIQQNKGVTLVEMLIAVALVSVVISLGYMFFFTGYKAFDRNVDRVDLQQNVRHSLSYMTRMLLNANNADVVVTTIAGSPDEVRIGRELFRLAGTTLFVNHDYLNPQSPFNPFAEGITEFEVIRDGNMITLTISAGGAQQSEYFTLSTQVLLRR